MGFQAVVCSCSDVLVPSCIYSSCEIIVKYMKTSCLNQAYRIVFAIKIFGTTTFVYPNIQTSNCCIEIYDSYVI